MSASSPAPKPEITFDDFDRVDVRVGTIVAAEPFPEARIAALEGGGTPKPATRKPAAKK